MITRAHAHMIRKRMEQSAASLNDEDALTAIELYPLWKVDTEYSVDFRVRYKDTLYKCIQAHTSQASWTPDITAALWTRVTVEEWPEWVQPTGATDAYMTGDKVSHNGQHYISTADFNIWEPGVYGWDLA